MHGRRCSIAFFGIPVLHVLLKVQGLPGLTEHNTVIYIRFLGSRKGKKRKRREKKNKGMFDSWATAYKNRNKKVLTVILASKKNASVITLFKIMKSSGKNKKNLIDKKKTPYKVSS